jgi:large subunit ribosomal protein L20
MPRVKTGVVRHRRHTKVLQAAKGFQHARHKRYKVAHEAVMHAGRYAYVSRRLKKRDFRKLWIQRINAGLNTIDQNLSYSVFIKLLSDHKIEINRKMLSELALNNMEAFQAIVTKVYGK